MIINKIFEVIEVNREIVIYFFNPTNPQKMQACQRSGMILWSFGPGNSLSIFLTFHLLMSRTLIRQGGKFINKEINLRYQVFIV